MKLLMFIFFNLFGFNVQNSNELFAYAQAFFRGQL